MTKEIKKLIAYLALVFGLSYTIQIVICTLAPKKYTLAAITMMFMPMLSVLIISRGLTKKRAGVCWKPNVKKNAGWLIFSWFSPVVFTALGTALYFLFFFGDFTAPVENFISLLTNAGAEIEDGKLDGVSAETILALEFVSCITIAPLINIIPSLGEEIGWRGYMTPELTKLLGRRKGLIASGIIWGLWHAPLIVLVGYEYGTDYPGAPFTGVLLFCLVTTILGVIMSFVYDKTQSIIYPALLHGSFNAAATLPQLFVSSSSHSLLGPYPTGLISILPMLITAAVIFLKETAIETSSTD